MLALAGLGNPGQDYRNNRHNIGFMAADSIYAHGQFSPWRKKFQAEIAEGLIEGEKVLLVKPQTFINNSGQSLGPLMQFYKLKLADIIVLHDDLDLAPEKIRIKRGGSSGGHNGLKSIDAHCGKDYLRVRLGIGRPEHEKDAVIHYVLGDFSKAEQASLAPMLEALGRNIGLCVAGDYNGFMNKIFTETHKAGINNNHSAAKQSAIAQGAEIKQKANKAAAKPSPNPPMQNRPEQASPSGGITAEKLKSLFGGGEKK